MARFALARDVFACVAGRHVVLLDVKRDEYLALDATAAHGLAALVSNWPSDGGAEASIGSSATVRTLARQLVAHGLLAPSMAGPHETADIPTRQRIRNPRADLRESIVPADQRDSVPPGELFPGDRALRITAREWAGILRASFTARALLACYPLAGVLERVRRRKERQSPHRRRDAAELARLISVFEHLRPFFHSAHDACLLDALALIEFLAVRGYYPTWVFGVRTRPFAAHCWVQEGIAVCNDTLERVCRYIPIMAI